MRGSSNPIFSSEGRFNTKKKRVDEYRKTLTENNVPESYRFNTTKEELCAEYVKKFTDQFLTINPKRKQLYMMAENECGIQKLVCSTLRPTEIQFTDLYDMHECAAYFAGFILFEPLQIPTEPPKILNSPAQTLRWHTGDSFDMAVLLCSFLLGNGYDAYVVNGYAPKYITLRDQSKTQCPLASSLLDTPSFESEANDEESVEKEEQAYKLPPTGAKESKFVSDQLERKRLEGLDTFVLWASDADNGQEGDTINDGIRRAHAWVLIRAGRREVREHTFLEPSTGRAYSTSNSPYLGIESVWNDRNIFMNTNVEKAVSMMDFELLTSAQWEYLFIPPQASVKGNQERHEEPGGDDGTAVVNDSNSSDVDPSLDPPPTWVQPLILDRPQYLLRYPPHGKRTVLYQRAKVDYYSKNSHPQAMVMRAVLYLDKARTIPKEVHEWFENRKDKMYKRVRHCLESKVSENYYPGNVGDVKQWVEYAGKRREIDFYVNARLDRLRRREEDIGKRVCEFYEGRTDRQTFRSIIISVDKADAGGRASYTLPGGGLASELYILKMTQSFSTDPAVPSGTDISKRVFYVTDGKVQTQYHFVEGRITRVTKSYNHQRGGGGGLPGQDDGGGVEDQTGLQEAAAVERECYLSVRRDYERTQELIKVRADFENNVVIERTVFEKALEKVDNASGPGGVGGDGFLGQDAKGVDYLTPYLRSAKDPGRLTREEAHDIKQACLEGLKARLVERMNIVQSSLNKENANLTRKQEQFQRSQREGDISTEEYEKYCTETMFRIAILEDRLRKHDDAALKKYAALSAKLESDPRLRVLRG